MREAHRAVAWTSNTDEIDVRLHTKVLHIEDLENMTVPTRTL